MRGPPGHLMCIAEAAETFDPLYAFRQGEFRLQHLIYSATPG
jgi:hypothetical protein